MHENLSHLSPEEFAELLKRYYDPEKEWTVTRIMQHFRIGARPGELTSLLPPTVHEDLFCNYCESTHLISRALPRSAQTKGIPFCPNCGHRRSGTCDCPHCRKRTEENRLNAERQRRDIIRNCYEIGEFWGKSPPELTLRQLVFLKAVASHAVSETLSHVDPFRFTQNELAPTLRFRLDIVRELYRLGLIAPDPESKLSAFSFQSAADGSPRYFLEKVDWLLLPGLSNAEKKSFLTEIDQEFDKFERDADASRGARALWHDIVKDEAFEYYCHKLNEIHYSVDADNFGDKTHQVFDSLVINFSLSEIYHIIFVTIRNTNHYITQQCIPKYQGKNMFVGGLERNAQKYRAEGWLKKYRRDFNCPQSTLNSVFFDFFLGFGGAYFDKVAPANPDDEAA